MSALTRSVVFLAALLLILIAVLRIRSTALVLSPTFDEPHHLAAGIELLSTGKYNYEPKHTPLGRVATALPLFLQGVRSMGLPVSWDEGNALLASGGRFRENLATARSGTLVFFVLAASVVFLWSKERFGPWIALVSLLQFTLVPPILAHSGFVTTDLAGVGAHLLCFWMLLRWTEQPTLARTIAACLSFSLALICKLSIVPFTVAVAGLWLLRRWSTSGSLKEALRIPIRIKHLALGMALGFLLVWSAYGFRSESLSAARTVRNFQATLDTSSLPKRVFSALLDVPIPAGNMIRGFGDLLLSEHGQIIPQYFRGEVKEDGWLLYFPIAFAIKIPLSLAIMGALALYFAIRQRNAAAYYPLGVALMIFLICLPTRWNVGTRYLLAIFPLIAIASGVVIQTLWMARKNTWAARGVLLALIGWLATDSIRAHPDYLPYFNPLAGAHPEAILVECDLDWGQDFYRLQDTLPSLEPRPLYLDYYGSTPPEIYGVKEYTHVPEQPVSGWVAVSIRNMVFFPEKYAWLESYPWRTLGKTIRLYDTGTLHDAPYTAPANRIEAMTRLQLR